MKTQTVLLYMAGDNDLALAGIINDLRELQTASTEIQDINLILQFETSKKVAAGIIEENKVIRRLYSRDKKIKYPDIPPINTGASETLAEFINWGVAESPADEYALILWGHGSGAIDHWEQHLTKAIAFDFGSGDYLTTKELATGIENADMIKGIKETGCRFNFIGFDACLMGCLEVVYELRAFSDIFILSQETIPATGWPYDLVVKAIDEEQNIEDAACTICRSYLKQFDEDKRVTLSALTLKQIDRVIDAFRIFSALLMTHYDPSLMFSIRKTVCSFEDLFIDLIHFIELIHEYSKSDALRTAAADLKTALDRVIISNVTQNADHANGISMMFPLSSPTKPILEPYELLAFTQTCPDWLNFINRYYKPLE